MAHRAGMLRNGGAPVTESLPFSSVRTWLFDAALPFWAEHGAGGPAGFHEKLALDGTPIVDTPRRVRAIARQVYVFSHAALLGWDGPALDRAGAGVEALRNLAWQGEERGWARLLAPDGSVLDGRADLYDWSFIMYAFGWWARASGDADALAQAELTLDMIERDMAHPSGRGHLHILPFQPPHAQNPHMHLTEACLALDEAGGGPRWLEKAGQIVDLFQDRFFDSNTGCLAEFFDDGWRPTETGGHIVEPGHQLEWAWIMGRYMDQSGRNMSSVIPALVECAERCGLSPRSGLVCAAVTRDGGVLDPAHRIWPQTERIKGNLALFEITGDDRTAQISAALTALLDDYLAPAPHGAWIDAVDERRAPVAADIPSSTFYHLFLAFSELLRLQSKLDAADRTDSVRIAARNG